MIIQAALMRQGETFAVESPEAHMHPSLQIKITELFLEQIKSGRQFILETHSDLIVRRAIRALLEEDVKQDDVRIYFTRVISLKDHPILKSVCTPYTDEKTSILEPIKINDLGQIENWPPGFLDADIIESRRLMDAMYGAMEKKNAE
jgi:predicted ATPase